MAEVSNTRMSVKVLVNLFYDEKTKRVHLTSNDRGLGAGGVHTNLKPGTAFDLRSRALLRSIGIEC